LVTIWIWAWRNFTLFVKSVAVQRSVSKTAQGSMPLGTRSSRISIPLMRRAVLSSATWTTPEVTRVFTPSSSSLRTILSSAAWSVIGVLKTGTKLGLDETPNRATMPAITRTAIPMRSRRWNSVHLLQRFLICPKTFLKKSPIDSPPQLIVI